jgi:nitrite reductase (NADH) large subunit
MTWWRTAQLLGLLATVALLATLTLAPTTGLTLLWDVAVPVLPAVFLIQPGIWRNVCPLATLSMITNRRGGLILDNGRIATAGAFGIVLLALMVPARRFLYNIDGTMLAATIVGVAVIAMALGAVFDKKAGFCSGICPVLPVERLYGQHPMLPVANARCTPCTMCTTRGCLDMAQSKSIAQTLGRERKSHGWLQTPFGAFAAAFPGFILGYNLTRDGDLASAGSVYLTVGLTAAASYGLTQALVRSAKLTSATAIRLLGAIAFGLYYWFAAASVSKHLHFPASAPAGIRAAALLLLLTWLWKSAGTPERHRASA